MEINPTEQIESISQFRMKTGKLLKLLGKKKTILLTQHGKTRAILVDPSAYEEHLEKIRLAEKILRADQEIDRGEGIPHEEVEERSRHWLDG